MKFGHFCLWQNSDFLPFLSEWITFEWIANLLNESPCVKLEWITFEWITNLLNESPCVKLMEDRTRADLNSVDQWFLIRKTDFWDQCLIRETYFWDRYLIRKINFWDRFFQYPLPTKWRRLYSLMCFQKRWVYSHSFFSNLRHRKFPIQSLSWFLKLKIPKTKFVLIFQTWRMARGRGSEKEQFRLRWLRPILTGEFARSFVLF